MKIIKEIREDKGLQVLFLGVLAAIIINFIIL